MRSADTDDLGEYPIASLPAGTYVVSARPGLSVPEGDRALDRLGEHDCGRSDV